jgi:hypothetical protein
LRGVRTRERSDAIRTSKLSEAIDKAARGLDDSAGDGVETRRITAVGEYAKPREGTQSDLA